MTIFEYKCPECQQPYTSTQRGDRLEHICMMCDFPGPLVRVFSVSLHRPMMAHFNNTTKTEISDPKQFANQLKKMSDEASEYAGQEHRYEPVDIMDTKTLGVTEQGLEHTNRNRVSRGLKPIDLTTIN